MTDIWFSKLEDSSFINGGTARGNGGSYPYFPGGGDGAPEITTQNMEEED